MASQVMLGLKPLNINRRLNLLWHSSETKRLSKRCSKMVSQDWIFKRNGANFHSKMLYTFKSFPPPFIFTRYKNKDENRQGNKDNSFHKSAVLITYEITLNLYSQTFIFHTLFFITQFHFLLSYRWLKILPNRSVGV